MEQATKGVPPTRSFLYPSSTNMQLKPSEPKEIKCIFDFKEMFDQSNAKIGLERPIMGSSGWNNEKLENGTEENLDSLNIAKLSCKPLVNLLHIPGVEERGVLTRYLYYAYVTSTRDTSHTYPSIKLMKQRVLEDEKLHHAIQKTIHSSQKEEATCDLVSERRLEKQLKRRAVALLDEMVATVTSKALRFCGWLFLTLLRQLTASVHLHEGQLEVIRTLSKANKPIIYFPLHFSHFDYILLSLSLYHNEIRSPFVASGNNLLIQPFSAIMRRVGGFFIRRKIDNGSEKDLVYRAVLHSYVTELLKSNQSIEIFIEGTRSRSGLPNLPKTGLLSVAVEALENGNIDDVVLVPVCMSYEKVLEGSFHKELMGRSKVPETFMFSITSIAKMLFGFYGHIRVNFGVPQSLKKTLYELRTSPTCSYTVANDTLPRSKSLYDQVTGVVDNAADGLMQTRKTSSTPSVESASASASQHLHKLSSPSSAPLLGGKDAKEDVQTREIVSLLGERIVYSSVQCRAYMSTNLVAFLLLHKWRNGVAMPELVESFRQLTVELLSRKCDVGFSGDFYVVVMHAVNLLGGQLVELDCAYSNRIQRSASCTSVRSRRSADSGYDLEEGNTSNKQTSYLLPPSPQSVELTSEKTLSGSDSGEEMSWNDHEEMTTGQYMSASEEAVGMSERMTQVASSIGPISMQTSQAHASSLKLVTSEERFDVCLSMTPQLNVPYVFDLSYYANALTPLFALESIVALAIGACLHLRFSALEKQLHVMLANTKQSYIEVERETFPQSTYQSFLRSTLFDKAIELVDLLQMDLILCDVTTNLDRAISESIDKTISNGYLTSETYGDNVTKKSAAAQELCFEDEDPVVDEWLKVNVACLPSLITIQSVMSSIVEGYVAASMKLPLLLMEPLSEEKLKKEMLSSAQERVKAGVAVRNESCSSDVIRNAFRSFEWNNVIEKTRENGRDVFQLADDYADRDSVANLISRLSQFLL